MLDSLIATYVKVRGSKTQDVQVLVGHDGTFRRWLVYANDENGSVQSECNRTYSDRESAILAAEALAMRLHQGGKYATAAEYNRAMELEG